MVIINNVIIKQQNQIIINGLSATLTPGHVTCFIGKSGAGKTTLLQALAGLVPVSQGSILINDKELYTLSAAHRAEQIGYVFQQFNLFPHMTVLDNCIDPLLVHHFSYEKARTIALTTLQELDMHEHAHKFSHELSGGQLQRAAIARALCLSPRVILLDEPTASLDPANTDLLVSLLQSLAARGLTVGLSSQDMSFVRKVMDRIYYLEEGTIKEFWDKDQVDESPVIQRWLNI